MLLRNTPKGALLGHTERVKDAPDGWLSKSYLIYPIIQKIVNMNINQQIDNKTLYNEGEIQLTSNLLCSGFTCTCIIYISFS